MLKVGPITKALFPEGIWTGVPCILVNFDSKKAEEKTTNQILDEIFQRELRSVLVKGKLKENPEIREIIAGLSQKGKVVTFVTNGSDDIQTLRTLRNVRIFMRVKPPTEESNDLVMSNFPLLKEEDEIKFNIRSKQDYDQAVKFLNSRLITRPVVLFSLLEELGEETMEVIAAYLNDCTKFKFRNRITKGLKL